MQVFIILATVSLIIIFSILKYFEYRKENTEDCEGEWSWSECDKKCSDGDSVRYGTFRTLPRRLHLNGNCEAKTGDTEERKRARLQNVPRRTVKVAKYGQKLVKVLVVVIMQLYMVSI